MRHIPYLVCVLCVQEIAICQSQLAQPSNTEQHRAELEEEVQVCQSELAQLYTYTQHIREGRRAYLEEGVRDNEDWIQHHKQRIAECNSDLARAEWELAELGEFINNIDTLITQLIIMQDNMQDKLETNNNSLRVYICMYVYGLENRRLLGTNLLFPSTDGIPRYYYRWDTSVITNLGPGLSRSYPPETVII